MLLISCNFIDMAENYASTGTGNVLRFCQGVASIKIQNKVLVVLDNYTSGVDAFHRVQALSLPRNLRVTVLPTLDEMTNFRTLGPAGESLEGVRCGGFHRMFLDLRFAPVHVCRCDGPTSTLTEVPTKGTRRQGRVCSGILPEHSSKQVRHNKALVFMAISLVKVRRDSRDGSDSY